MKKLSGRQVAIVGTICLFLGALLLAVAGLYAAQFDPSPAYRPSGRRRLLYNFLQNILCLAQHNSQGRILVLIGGGLFLCGIALTLLARRMG